VFPSKRSHVQIQRGVGYVYLHRLLPVKYTNLVSGLVLTLKIDLILSYYICVCSYILFFNVTQGHVLGGTGRTPKMWILQGEHFPTSPFEGDTRRRSRERPLKKEDTSMLPFDQRLSL